MFEFNYNKYLVLKEVGYEEFIEVLKAFSNMEGGAKEYSLYFLARLYRMKNLYEFVDNLCFFVELDYTCDSRGMSDMDLEVYVDDKNYTLINSIKFFDEHIFIDTLKDANKRAFYSEFDDIKSNLHQLEFL